MPPTPRPKHSVPSIPEHLAMQDVPTHERPPFWLFSVESFAAPVPGIEAPSPQTPPLVWRYLTHARMDAAGRLVAVDRPDRFSGYLRDAMFWFPCPKPFPTDKQPYYPAKMHCMDAGYIAYAKTNFHLTPRIDGSCNHLTDTSWAAGVSITSFKRIAGTWGNRGDVHLLGPGKGERPDTLTIDTDKLNELRRNKNVSGARFGSQNWHRYRKGDVSCPRHERLEDIAQAFGVTPDVLCYPDDRCGNAFPGTTPNFPVGTGLTAAWPVAALERPTTTPARLELELAWFSGSRAEIEEAELKMRKAIHEESLRGEGFVDGSLVKPIIPTKEEIFVANAEHVAYTREKEWEKLTGQKPMPNSVSAERLETMKRKRAPALKREDEWEKLTGQRPAPDSISIETLEAERAARQDK